MIICGCSHEHLRSADTLREQFLATITELGFDPAGLVWLDSPAERVASSQ